MGSDSKEQGAGDLWELTIDDLFLSSDAAASELHAAVPGPFAIDLCTSVEPATELAPSLQSFEQLHAYQVTDWKDDQLVFRLRLGPIDSELEADAIVSIVRRDYPDATTVPVGEDDLRMLALVESSAPVRNSKPRREKAETAAKAETPAKVEAIAKTEKVGRVERLAKAEKVTPVATVAEPPEPEPPAVQAVRAAKPAAAPAAEKPEDFANLFRDLAAELLAPVPLAPDVKAPRRNETPAMEGAAAPVPPPVLTAAVKARQTPRGAARSRGEPTPRSGAEASPPVLKMDSVARPPRERAERRDVTRAAALASPRAVAPHAPATATPATRESTPLVADETEMASEAAANPMATADSASAAWPAASRARDPSAPPIPLAPPLPTPPVTSAASRDGTVASAAPVPPVTVARANEPPRVALARAPQAPAALAPLPAPAPAPEVSFHEWVVPAAPTTGPAPTGIADAPAPIAGAAAAKPPEPPRVALPRAPASAAAREPLPTIAAGDSASGRSAETDVASGTPAVALPRLHTEPGPAPRTYEPPRVALRQEQATSKAPAKPAETAPASARLPEPVSRATEPPRVTAPADRAPAAHAVPELQPAPKFDLELLADDIAWATDELDAAPAAASPAPSVKASEPAPIAPPSMVMELVPDAPRPSPAATIPTPPAQVAPSAPPPEPARVLAPPPALELVADAPRASPGPKPEAPPTRHVAQSTASSPWPPAAPTATVSPTRVTEPTKSTTPSPTAAAAKASPARSDVPVPKPAMPQRVHAPAPPTPKPAVAVPRAQMPTRPAAQATPVPPAAAAARKAEPPATPKAATPPGPPPIDSTQTLRALVVPEEAEQASEKLLVIQLLLSEREIEPDSVPNLAIFNEYRLYSAVGYEQGKVMHALRLGFFTDTAPAEAVAGYLRSYFEAPVVTRVSAEERERFARRRVSARKDSGETGLHAAIELSSAPSAPTTSLADLSARSRSGPAAKPGHERKRG